MIYIHIYNDYFYLQSDDVNLLHECDIILYKNLSYEVPNAEWSDKFKSKVWDGKISLYYKKMHRSPTGLASRAIFFLQQFDIPHRVYDKRNKPDPCFHLCVNFDGKSLREYQKEAVAKAISSTRGMLALATAAGKTIISCQLLAELKTAPVLFVVPSISLLKQTTRTYQKYLSVNGACVEIGQIGGGECVIQPNGINIATWQSLLTTMNMAYDNKKHKIVDNNLVDTSKTIMPDLLSQLKILQRERQYAKGATSSIDKQINNINLKIKKCQAYIDNKNNILNLLQNVQVLIIDEAHIAVEIIEFLSLTCKNAYYKFGLSATPFRTDNQELRMEGAMGKKIYEVGPSDLIKKGYLVPPQIYTIPMKAVSKAITYAQEYNINIVENWERNYRIKQLAEAFRSKGLPTCVLVDRIEHGKILEQITHNSVFVPGGDESDEPMRDGEIDYRKSILDKVERNEIIGIFTSWANTGIDCPNLTVMILGGSCSSPVTTYQQIGRVLRKSENLNKNEAIIIDLFVKSKRLSDHFHSRRQVYEIEPEFKVIKIKSGG